MIPLPALAVSYPSCLDWVPHLESWCLALGVLGAVGVALRIVVLLFKRLERALGVPIPDRAGRHAGVALAGVVQRLDQGQPDADRLRDRYVTLEYLDALFAVGYSVGLAAVVAFFATEAVAENGGTWPAAWLALTPLLLGVADLVEDVLIYAALEIRGLHPEHGLIAAASYASTAKTFLMAATGGVVLSTIVWWAPSYF